MKILLVDFDFLGCQILYVIIWQPCFYILKILLLKNCCKKKMWACLEKCHSGAPGIPFRFFWWLSNWIPEITTKLIRHAVGVSGRINKCIKVRFQIDLATDDLVILFYPTTSSNPNFQQDSISAFRDNFHSKIDLQVCHIKGPKQDFFSQRFSNFLRFCNGG